MATPPPRVAGPDAPGPESGPSLEIPNARDLIEARPGPLGALLPPPFVVPRYDGRSVGNVPATVGALLGTNIGPLPTLEAGLWSGLVGDGVDRVVLLVIDALGWNRLSRALAEVPASVGWLAEAGAVAAPLTSIFPSTTSATLTTIWTGYPPVTHGLLGYRLWLRELGLVANAIRFKPAAKGLAGDLLAAGLDEEAFLPVPTVGEQLAAAHIEFRMLMPGAIKGSGLSRVTYRGSTELAGHYGLGDGLTALRELLDETAGRRALVGMYWDTFDTVSHVRGPGTYHWSAEWHVLSGALRDLLVERLSPAARRRTVFALTADHGHVALAKHRVVAVEDHPALRADLLLQPTGDARAPYLHVRAGRRAAVRTYVESELAHAFHVLDADEALAAGLWGPGPAHPETLHRLGDLVLLARDGYCLRWRHGAFRTLSRHGSLLPDEALVPWLAWRLD